MNAFLTGKKVIVTGGSRGIGKETAIALQAAGAEVTIICRTPLTSTMRSYVLDLADIPQIKPRLQEIIADCGGVDILINNAGVGYVGELIHTPLEEWQKTFDLNVTSVFQCIQAVLPTMRLRHSGTIVTIASIAGKKAFPKWGVYSASKFALLGLTEALAAEEQPYGIKVMALCPGAVNTPLWDTLDPEIASQFDRQKMLSPGAVAQTIVQLLQLSPYVTIPEVVVMPAAGIL